jgi:hypothetical protein
MYLRVTTRKNKDGSTVRYLQLAHNEWDATAGMSRPKVVYNFGREDQLDRAAVNRLIASLSRVVEPAALLAATGPAELEFRESRPMGGAYVLDGLWRRLGISKIMAGLAAGRRLDPRVERVLFALVANRALKASSTLAAAGWVCHDAHVRAGWARSTRTPATGRWIGCWRSKTNWPRKCSGRSPHFSILMWT